MKHVVFLPGLGADERMFQSIELKDCNIQFIKWLKPVRNETLPSYLKKIKEQIVAGHPPILVGVSLGGIMAMELRELIPVEKTIIISSIKTKSEMPGFFRWARKTRINKMIPATHIKKLAPVIKLFISDKSNKKGTGLFKSMLQNTDDDFIKMAIKFVLEWQRTDYSRENLVHIHGTKDILLPIRNITRCDYKIKDGTHDMVMSRPEEINKILTKEIFNTH